MSASPSPLRAASPLWDAVGFLLGLALAIALSWQPRDLIWSLWLSSLVLGYATIVLGITGAVRRSATGGLATAGSGVLGLFLLAFFTVHFGGFHAVHAVFLCVFFPLHPAAHGAFPLTWETLGTVVASYWPWLLSAAIAERAALLQAWRSEGGDAKTGGLAGFNPMGPYRNVIRMHLLIFFFAGAHFAGLGGAWVLAVVFAVYFFPWRLLKTAPPEPS